MVSAIFGKIRPLKSKLPTPEIFSHSKKWQQLKLKIIPKNYEQITCSICTLWRSLDGLVNVLQPFHIPCIYVYNIPICMHLRTKPSGKNLYVETKHLITCSISQFSFPRIKWILFIEVHRCKGVIDLPMVSLIRANSKNHVPHCAVILKVNCSSSAIL